MKRFLQSEIGAAVLWVLCSILLAAVISPWAYQGGKWLAAHAAARDLAAPLEWLAASCGRADLGRYFDRSLMFSALVLLPVLFRRIRRLRAAPGEVVADVRTPYAWQSAALQILMACVIAGGLLWTAGAILEAAGAYAPKSKMPGVGKMISKIVIPAVAAPLVEEWLFRGVLLGLWLRFAKPAAACIGTSLVFAFVHFLNPPDGTEIATPGGPFAGFELLGEILRHFTNPVFFITDFATLWVVGLILAWARMRTGALWFSIGLHAGWVAAFKAFNLFYRAVDDHALRPWGVGETLRSGLIPLFTLGLTAIVCHFALKRFSRASR